MEKNKPKNIYFRQQGFFISRISESDASPLKFSFNVNCVKNQLTNFSNYFISPNIKKLNIKQGYYSLITYYSPLSKIAWIYSIEPALSHKQTFWTKHKFRDMKFNRSHRYGKLFNTNEVSVIGTAEILLSDGETWTKTDFISDDVDAFDDLDDAESEWYTTLVDLPDIDIEGNFINENGYRKYTKHMIIKKCKSKPIYQDVEFKVEYKNEDIREVQKIVEDTIA